MTDKFNHLTVLRYVICLYILADYVFTKTNVQQVKQVCINNVNSASTINMTCPKLKDRIEVVSVTYFYLETKDVPKSCTSATSQCNKSISTGQELKDQNLYYLCAQSLHGCLGKVGNLPPLPVEKCSGDQHFYFLLMKYHCVQAKRVLSLCGNYSKNITSNKYLGHFIPENEINRIRDCTCSIQGRHSLKVIYASVPKQQSYVCPGGNTRIISTSNSDDEITIPQGEDLINVDVGQFEESQIRMKENCSDYTPPVWFKIIPVGSKTVQIQCTSIGTSSSTSSQVSSTTSQPAETSTPPPSSISPSTAKNDRNDSLPDTGKIPVIVGSVIGALVLTIILIVIGVLVYRRKRREKTPSGLDRFDGAVHNAHTYDEVYARNHQTYTNNTFEEGAPDYSSVGETDVIVDITNGTTSVDYDQLKPATIFQTFPNKNKKANSDQHNEVPLYDHTKKQTKDGHSSLPGNDNYDVLESKTNLNSSSNQVETSEDDTYNHIGNNHKESSNTTDQLMPNAKYTNAPKSAPEYATVNKHREEEEQGNLAESDGKDANFYHILEEQTTQEIQTGADNEESGRKADNNPKRFNVTENPTKTNDNLYHILEPQD